MAFSNRFGRIFGVFGASSCLGVLSYQKFKVTVEAASEYGGTPQDNILSPLKKHSLFLWIHVNTESIYVSDLVREAASLPSHIQTLYSDFAPKNSENEILAGVGFGQDLLAKVNRPLRHQLKYEHRTGIQGDLENTGGDVFIHAKSDNPSQLLDLARLIQKKIPPALLIRFQDTHGFNYQNENRDLCRFELKTELPQDSREKAEIAICKQSGGSFCLTQKWIHKMPSVERQPVENLEKMVGRSVQGNPLWKKLPTSHIAKMTTSDGRKVMIRQSMAYGTAAGPAGVFYIGFTNSLDKVDKLLDRMVGSGKDIRSDEIMKISNCVEGTYWYFPSKEELKELEKVRRFSKK